VNGRCSESAFGPRQVEAFGLGGQTTLDALLEYPFELLRLGDYWDRIETSGREFDTQQLDWQLAAAERAGKMVILSVGPVKNFGYPEFYVPKHQLDRPLREGALLSLRFRRAFCLRPRASYPHRHRGRDSVVAWQFEHEAVDPLGSKHSWGVRRPVRGRTRDGPHRGAALGASRPSRLI